MNRLCCLAGCGRRHDSRGYCSMHVRRLLKSGDAGPAARIRAANGLGSVNENGYVVITVDGKQRRLHDVLAERALGRRLPPGAVVHHADGVRTNNAKTNLVICPSPRYHALLHVRMAAQAEAGNPDLRKCKYCKQYDLPSRMRQLRNRESFVHNACNAERQRINKGLNP